jgi:hypothetical protein
MHTKPIIQSATFRSHDHDDHNHDHYHQTRVILCASLLASSSLSDLHQRIVAHFDEARLACAGALTDALIPGPDEIGALLAYACADPVLLSDEPEGYDTDSNRLSPAALLYENLYRQTFAWVEGLLGQIVRLATHIRRVQDEERAAMQARLEQIDRIDHLHMKGHPDKLLTLLEEAVAISETMGHDHARCMFTERKARLINEMQATQHHEGRRLL